jgi:single-stranded-DNA-specific exonuclease
VLIEHRELSSETPLDTTLPPILDRLLRLRGVSKPEEVSTKASHLLHFSALKGIEAAATVLADALERNLNICIVGDFDADGATSTALCLLSLQAFGHKNCQFIVPNRFDFGYGLTPPVVDMALEQGAQLIVTVDNGISSIEGVAYAKSHELQVIVTDHHLAGASLPEADAIVNPNQPGCEFASKHLAGVGVAFYVMSALKAKLNERGFFDAKGISSPNLANFLDIVALGTVADVVALDQNNRILVHQGLQRIRSCKTRPGILAMLKVASREPSRLASSDLGFVLGPRLNAAGRLTDMSVGIHCLLTEDPMLALELASELDSLNRERRSIEQDMQMAAQKSLDSLQLDADSLPDGIVLYHGDYHQGVVGILAGRIKEQYFRPTIAFANENSETLKGSARSIPGVHMRDLLERIHTLYPGLIIKFGGHAMAAGLSLEASRLEEFRRAFEIQSQEAVKHLPRAHTLLSDGALSSEHMGLDTAQLLKLAMPWGQQFEEPLFDDVFELIEQRIVGEKHLKMLVRKEQQLFDAIAFNVDVEQWPNMSARRVHLAYRLDVNEFRGQVNVQLMVTALVAVP